MTGLAQKLVPGIVGISTYVDFAYQKEMQRAAVAASGSHGPINQLRTVTATLDFRALIVNLQSGQRTAAEQQVADCIATLKAAGADFVVVTSGTTSTLTGLARRRTAISYLGLATACFRPAPPPGPIGLLSTSYAAAGGLFHDAADRAGVRLIVPSPGIAAEVDRVIFSELVEGSVAPAGLAVFRNAIAGLVEAGAGSIILGNTDLTLIAENLRSNSPVPLIDSALAHARDAARAALSGEI